jgi:hypothetical protein
MEFNSKHTINSKIQIKHNNKTIVSRNELKFLGLVLHNTMSWKSHIDMLATKLNKACYNLSRVFSFSNNILYNILGNLFPQFEHFQTPKTNGQNTNRMF